MSSLFGSALLRSSMRGLWRHADFLKLWAGQTASLFGTWIGGFAYDLVAILTLHASAGEIAILNGCGLAPGMLAAPWVGVWADRLRRRPLLIAADLGRALTLASIPVAALAHTLSMAQLYLVAALISVLTVLFDVSYRSYLPSLIEPEDLIEGNSKLQASAAVAEAGGFGLAGLLVQLFTAPIAILFDVASFFVSALSLAAVRRSEGRPGPPGRDVPGRAWGDLREGLSAVRRDAVLRALAATQFTWELVGNTVGVVIMLFFLRDLHVEPGILGPLCGIGGVSGFVGALLAGRVLRRWGLGPTLIGSLYVNNVGLLAVVLAGGPLPLVLALLAVGQATDGGRAIYEIHSVSLLQSRAPAHLAGRINASFEALRSTAMLLGLAVGGELGQTVGYRATLGLALAASLLVPLCLVFSPVQVWRSGGRVVPGQAEAGVLHGLEA